MSRKIGECFAEVEFSVKEGRFRCHWSQHRSRRSPDGELQQPRHEMVDAQTGRVLETRLKEVALLVERVTGMDYDRFTRSILLAQGGFAAFLEAEADQRAPILEQITGTAFFRVREDRASGTRDREHIQTHLSSLNMENDGVEREVGERLVANGLRPSTRLTELHPQLEKTASRHEEVRGLIAASERLATERAQVEKERGEASKRQAILALRLQEALHKGAAADREIRRQADARAARLEQLDNCLRGLESLLLPLGVAREDVSTPQPLLARLSEQLRLWKETVEKQTRLNQAQRDCQTELDKEILLLDTLDRERRLRSEILAARRQDIEELARERKAPFGQRDPDQEKRERLQLVRQAEESEATTSDQLAEADKTCHGHAEKLQLLQSEEVSILNQITLQEADLADKIRGAGFSVGLGLPIRPSFSTHGSLPMPLRPLPVIRRSWNGKGRCSAAAWLNNRRLGIGKRNGLQIGGHRPSCSPSRR